MLGSGTTVPNTVTLSAPEAAFSTIKALSPSSITSGSAPNTEGTPPMKISPWYVETTSFAVFRKNVSPASAPIMSIVTSPPLLLMAAPAPKRSISPSPLRVAAAPAERNYW